MGRTKTMAKKGQKKGRRGSKSKKLRSKKERKKIRWRPGTVTLRRIK